MGIIIRQSIKATIINYIGAFIGFLTTMFVITKYLQPEVVGLTKVIYESAFLFSSFAQLGISSSAIRFFPYFQNPERKNNGFFFYLMLIPCIGGVIFTLLCFILREPISDYFGRNSSLFIDYYLWVAPLMIFLLFWIVFETYANLLMRIVIPKFIREIAVRIMLLAIYLLYAFHYLDLNGLIIGMVIAYGVAMSLTFFYVSSIGTVSLKHNFSFIDNSLRLNVLKYTLYLVIGALGGNVIYSLDIFMITSEMGLNYAGIYTIAFYMAAVIEMPARSITPISSPLAAAALKEGDFFKANQLYKKVSLHQLIAGSTIFLFIWINIDNIFKLIPNGDIYSQGKWVVFFLAFSKLVSMTLGFGGTLVSFSKYYYWGLYFTFFLTILTISTNYLLIPIFGVTGAAMASFLTCLVSYSWQQWIVLQKIKGNPYSIGTLKQIGLILFLFGCNFLLPHLIAYPLADIFYRSFIIGIMWLFLTYRLRISDDICRLVDNVFPKS